MNTLSFDIWYFLFIVFSPTILYLRPSFWAILCDDWEPLYYWNRFHHVRIWVCVILYLCVSLFVDGWMGVCLCGCVWLSHSYSGCRWMSEAECVLMSLCLLDFLYLFDCLCVWGLAGCLWVCVCLFVSLSVCLFFSFFLLEGSGMTCLDDDPWLPKGKRGVFRFFTLFILNDISCHLPFSPQNLYLPQSTIFAISPSPFLPSERQKCMTLLLHRFFSKNPFYKNHQAQNWPKFKNLVCLLF